MTIIEKLGITPGPWGIVSDDGFYINHYSKEANCRPIHAETWSRENANIIAAAPEMLEALIKTVNDWNIGRNYRVYFGMNTDKYDDIAKMIEDFTAIIEKATGKSWEEIKELI